MRVLGIFKLCVSADSLPTQWRSRRKPKTARTRIGSMALRKKLRESFFWVECWLKEAENCLLLLDSYCIQRNKIIFLLVHSLQINRISSEKHPTPSGSPLNRNKPQDPKYRLSGQVKKGNNRFDQTL